jgi:alkaline phosphatase
MVKNSFKTIIFLLVIVLTGFSWNDDSEIKKKNKETRNIVLFIGGRMGVADLYAGMTVNNKTFSLEKFPYSGFSKTYSSGNYITDSEAGGSLSEHKIIAKLSGRDHTAVMVPIFSFGPGTEKF